MRLQKVRKSHMTLGYAPVPSWFEDKFRLPGSPLQQRFSLWKPTILIAEDADSREMMQILLEAKGYQLFLPKMAFARWNWQSKPALMRCSSISHYPR